MQVAWLTKLPRHTPSFRSKKLGSQFAGGSRRKKQKVQRSEAKWEHNPPAGQVDDLRGSSLPKPPGPAAQSNAPRVSALERLYSLLEGCGVSPADALKFMHVASDAGTVAVLTCVLGDTRGSERELSFVGDPHNTIELAEEAVATKAYADVAAQLGVSLDVLAVARATPVVTPDNARTQLNSVAQRFG